MAEMQAESLLYSSRDSLNLLDAQFKKDMYWFFQNYTAGLSACIVALHDTQGDALGFYTTGLRPELCAWREYQETPWPGRDVLVTHKINRIASG